VTKAFNHYVGKAGHLAVMAEFLMRGWNVAIPEVDTGDDIFVVQDENGTLRRVQVKTSMATERLKGFSGQFQIPLKQLRNIRDVLVHYVFIVRNKDKWTTPVVIPQDILLDYFENNKIGSEHDGNINLYFSYSENKVECSGLDFSKHVGDYTDFPILEH
jgi:hypothetical protein